MLLKRNREEKKGTSKQARIFHETEEIGKEKLVGSVSPLTIWNSRPSCKDVKSITASPIKKTKSKVIKT